MVALICGPVSARELPDDQAVSMTQVIAMAGKALAGGPPSGGPKLPKFEDVTKGMKSDEGLFTLWYYPSDAKDKDTEKLLCQIPASFLGEQFMLSISFSGGGFFTGFPWEERVVRWELLDRQLLLIEPQTGYVVDDSETVSDVVRRTYPDKIRASIPLVTKSPAGDPVIDLGKLLKSDFADISWMARAVPWMMGGGAGSINPQLSRWTKKKVFELNVEIGVELALSKQYPPGSYDKKIIHYSFWKLPESSYRPRVADDRVGYFVTANQDWSKPSGARDLFNRYVNRWNLEKRDPSLPLCEPKKPIVFYIEKTVPVRFRRAVRDGILEWNKAYEKIGFSGAVQVRQQTADNEWADLDPEDMRYSFFRWIVSGMSFAMGPSRVNPFTGEIYDADIIFDASMVRVFEQEAGRLLPSSAMAVKMLDPALQEFLDKYPQWKRPTREWESFMFGSGQDVELRDRMRRRMRERGCNFCEYSLGMRHQMSLARAALAGQPKEVIDKFLYDAIKEVVMHEVGHTLGLRHNFKASTVYSLDEIRKRRGTGQPTCGSVMDYNPALLFRDQATEGHYLTPTIGPWDYWAIEYGYRPSDGTYKKESGGDEAEGGDKDRKQAEEKPQAEAVAVGAGEIPKEVLDKLPEEVREMLASGKVKMGAGVPTPPKKPSRPAFKGADPAELKMLQEIASRAAEPELAYASDEDTTPFGPDPRSNRFDMGADPLDWARTRIELIDKRMENILDWAVKDEESWYHLRRTFTSLLVEKAFVLDYVGRYIGGQYTSRSHRGDPDAPPPFEVVDPDRQREALAFIEQRIFSDDFFKFSPEVLNHLAAPRWWHAGTNISFTVDYPIHDMIGLLQWWQLFDRLMPNTIRRIYDAELKTDAADKFTVAEYLQRLQKACWGDALDEKRAGRGTWTDAKPFVSGIRRSLQREYLSLMEPLVRMQPGVLNSPDLHAMLQHSLRKLSEGIGTVLETGKVDFASEAHLTACKSRIDRMLAPELREYSWFSPMGF
jgi:hypothetical protein